MNNLARKFFKKEWDELGSIEKRVVESIRDRVGVSRNRALEERDERTLGERVADRVAAFGGSWTFISIFASVLLFWVVLNSYLLLGTGRDFDPYPYILLNLFLSMLAAIQAPIIMMSQNRQAVIDRHDAAHDYEVNLKSEIEIMRIHEKLDELREEKWLHLIELQQEQIRMLTELLERKGFANEQILPDVQ